MSRYIVIFLVIFLVLFSLQLTEPVFAHVVEPFTTFMDVLLETNFMQWETLASRLGPTTHLRKNGR